MDSFELNKVAGAVLGTLLFALGTGFVAELIYHPKPAGTAGYALPGGGEGEHGGMAEGGKGGEAAAPKAESIAVRLASADAEKGKGSAKACTACHSFDKDGPNKIGPALWEVVGRPKGSHAGFDYSAGLKEKGGEWTYEDLDHFIENPKGYIKGTKMAFQGIGDGKPRADVIAYLRTLSDNPKPLPAAEKKEGGDAAKPEDGKKAEGEKKDEGKKAEGTKSEGPKPDNDGAGKPAEAEKKAEPAKPAADESADTDRPGGSGKAQSQIESKENPPEAKPAQGAADVAPKTGEGPAATQAPAQADPEAEKKAEQLKEGGETKSE